ncbi:DUF3034 family protein [Pleionea litopenaei]|uniref:DUF3034 family protein n=1 Tax=Pleionea litopenaei TaxID=3070815 RepID=A0AA51RUE7_9GAMM|nr:DUF3034 family protein [Pleionea sp. HL-JVS1]WMS87792.1 DUF3034 family protein [Pleionea sp. HL-JVS1]
MFRETIALLTFLISFDCIAQGKLLGTPGVSTFEGSAGGGIVPWAQLAGYDTENQWSANAFCSKVNLRDFDLTSCGVQVGLFDRVEVSYAEQTLGVQPLSTSISQEVIGAKFRLYGDIVYSAWPQVSLGIQDKSLKDSDVAFALGAGQSSGTDIYISASKLHLAAFAGRNLYWNMTARRTKANETGFLGFSSAEESSSINVEFSTALFLNQHWAIGFEYRQKPDNLTLNESAWKDLFVAWFPQKNLSVTAAYLDFGTIAGLNDQNGTYLSLTGYF